MSMYDEIFYVVRSAIDRGVSAAEFKKQVARAWDDALTEKQRFDAMEFAKS